MTKQQKNIHKITYPNATEFKYDQAKVLVIARENNEFGIQLGIVGDSIALDIPRAKHRIKDDMTITEVKISAKGAYTLMLALHDQLQATGLLLKPELK